MELTPQSNDMPAESGSGGFRFLGEQDGPFERILKARLVETFRDEAAVSRAYLARADLGDGSGIHVVLGLPVAGVEDARERAFSALKTKGRRRPSSRADAVNALSAGGEESEERRLAGKVGAIFASLFGANEHLDLLFISAPHEARLREVCEPFFERG